MKYLEDSYQKELETTVLSIKDNKFLVLNDTIFYPTGGGQPHDTGILIRKSDNKEFKVVFVGKFDGKVSHEVENNELKEGDEVICKLDWERRYSLMRAHTSAHIVSTLVHKELNALITGNQLSTQKVRIDFSCEQFDKEQLKSFLEKANEIIQRDLEVNHYFLPREEAEKLPQITQLAKGLPPGLKELRIVEIGDFDKQADAGTHVHSTKEIGKVEFLKAENKGKTFRRLYYTLN